MYRAREMLRDVTPLKLLKMNILVTYGGPAGGGVCFTKVTRPLFGTF
jgi:hypothetical protein